MRAEAERYRINDAVGNHGDIDLFSLGVVFGFGGPAPQEPPVASPPTHSDAGTDAGAGRQRSRWRQQ